MSVVVTGGAGFIGSTAVRHFITNADHMVRNFDKLTYAGNPSMIGHVAASDRYRFVQGDVCDANAVPISITKFRPHVITHLAAETHVD